MKKQILSIVGIAAICLSMMVCTSCGDSAATIVGSWKGQVDLGAVLTKMFAVDEDLQLMDLTIDHAQAEVILTFREDGTMEMVFEEASLKSVMINVSKQAIERTFSLMGMEITAQEYMETAQLTEEDLIGEVFSDETNLQGLQQHGTYRTDGDKLYVLTEQLQNEQAYIPYAIDSEALILNAPVGITAENDIQLSVLEAFFPMTWTKL